MRTIIQKTFENAFNEEQFSYFIKNLLNGIEARNNKNIPIPDNYREFIRSYSRIGKYIDPDENIIDVLIVKLQKDTSVERARTAQRNFIARYLNGGMGGTLRSAALVAFISDESPDWRFSLIKMDYKFEETEDGKRKPVKELSPAKRFSFLVGANENSHTAQKQLLKCLEKSDKKEQVALEDLTESFSIEKVSKEFFEKYRNLFADVKEELVRLYNEDADIKKDFDSHNINLVDFSKKTLGQLVFLYFLQKKGWLGVKKEDDWGNGDKRFLRNLFDKKYVDYGNFFNDILEPLFYEALANDRGTSAYYDALKCRIPFLNGGLFEPINNYKWEDTNIAINNNTFRNVFDTFDLYNFTIKEDEPLEKEVAVDPEMLGKVFEELLEVTERKSKGAFYTPREIVHYMCQESLINYLFTKIETVIKEDFSEFIHIGDSTYVNKSRKTGTGLPESIKQNAPVIDEALKSIKVCDPAIGSGAFPVGMMNEIVRARLALNEFIQDENRTPYKFKRHTIENSIYGVDIDGGAIEIAKLRFWLSLVVDEDDIKTVKPLPNLDYKIMQGNSLISSYEGIDFEEIIDNQKKEYQLNLLASESENVIVQLRAKQKDFLTTPYRTKKEELKQDIENLIIKLVEAKLKEKTATLTKEAEQQRKKLEEHIRNFAQNNEYRDFFPWKLYFADAFEQGGFDVVIGNPPYVSLEALKQPYKKHLDKYKCFAGKADLLYFFYERGINLTCKKGVLTFITSRYFLEATYAKKLREFFIKNINMLKIIDFGEIKIFENADIHTCIFFVENIQNVLNETTIIKFLRETPKIDLECKILKSNDIKSCFSMKQDEFGVEGWSFSDYKITAIRKKILQNCKLLNEIAVIEQGQKSGLNNVFNVSLETIKKYDLEKEPLKRCVKNSHINKYYVDFQEQYLIYTDDDFQIDKFPKIKEYLLENKEKLYNRAEANEDKYAWYRLQRPRKKSLFEVDEKIVVPYRATENKFAYDDKKYFNDGGDIRIIVITDNSFDNKYILSILNSKLMNFYYSFIGRRKGNVFEYFVEPLYKIPIKEISKASQLPFINVVEKILEITKTEDYKKDDEKQRQVKEYENQIDEMVYKLYGLTEEEILTIEPKRLLEQKFSHKPSNKDIVEKIATTKPELMDNDREFCLVFDKIALSNGYTEEELPKYWSIGRAIFEYKKEKDISASETAYTRVPSSKEINLDNPILNKFKFDKKPSIKEIISAIANHDRTILDNDRKLMELFDPIAISNGYELNSLPKYWNVIRAVFDFKKELTNV